MSELSELNKAVIELNELWTLCTDDELGEKLLEQRDELDTLAGDLADKTIRDGVTELNDAVTSLQSLTDSAVAAKQDIDDVAEIIRKTTDVVNKAGDAIGKVTKLIAVL